MEPKLKLQWYYPPLPEGKEYSKQQKYTRDNKIYAFGNVGAIQGFSTDGGGHSLDLKKMYKTNFTQPNKKFVLSLHYNHDDSYVFVNGAEQLKFKTDVNKIKRNPLTLGNISSDWILTNSTETGLFGHVYDFAIDYVSISGVKTIYDIHRYLMKKNNIV